MEIRFDLEEEKEHNNEYNKISPFHLAFVKKKKHVDETDYLLSTPANAARLMEGTAQYKTRKK